VKQINADIGAVLKMKDVLERFSGQGAEPYITTPEQFNEIARNDVAKWAVVVKESGATVD
jgi:tripartite-type tricarboxylate transporter receptor subunit TctC